MKIALTGATGIVGRFIVDDLQRRGIDVIALGRRNSDRSGFTQPPTWVQGSMTDRDALASLLAGADGVVHCALDHLPHRYRGGEGDDPDNFWQINLMGTLNLLEIACSQDVRRCVLLSSRAVFGRRRIGNVSANTPIPDDHPLWPDDHYGALKAATEALASAYSSRSNLCVTTLRPTGVYGLTHPANQSKWFDLARQARQRKTPAVNPDPIPANRIATEVHGVDVADAIYRLLTAPTSKVAGRGFNCSDLIVSNQQVLQQLQQLFQHPDRIPPSAPSVELTERVHNPMLCDGLTALGWQPGGVHQLNTTLLQLLQAARLSD